MRPTIWSCALTLCASLAVNSENRAYGVIIPIAFDGPGQTFSGEASAIGSASVVGAGKSFNPISGKVEPFSFIPPTTHPLLLSTTSLQGQPTSAGSKNLPTFDMSSSALLDISDLSLYFMYKASNPFAFDTIVATTDSGFPLLQNVTIDLSGKAFTLRFTQTAPATIDALAPGYGTFSIPGWFELYISDLNALVLYLAKVQIRNGSDTKSTLVGNYSITDSPSGTKLSLDGNFEFVALESTGTSVSYGIVTPFAVSVSATVGLLASEFVSGTFHLEKDGLAVPEPASVALLGVGLKMSSTLIWCRRRRSR